MERDAPLVLHLLGVGGVTAICLTVGYGVAWVAGLLWDWWIEENDR